MAPQVMNTLGSPAIGPVGLVRMPHKGDKVQTWSTSTQKWLEGTVEDVLTESFSPAGGLVMPKGSLRVRVSAGLRYVKPESVCSLKLALHVMVVAPGAGTGLNSDVYKELGEDEQIKVELCGSRGAAYDRYPPSWQNGKAPPNLETFAQELLAKPMGDVLVLGSRGGQVVLPRFWQRLGNQVPPAVVINGGCAMNLPGVKIPWPPQAVTIMLMGAQDFFKGQKSSAEYLTASKGHVPANSRTAILYVRQMQHMPSKALLQMVLGPLVMAAAMWKYSKNCPEDQLNSLTSQLEDESWSGSLHILQGTSWKEKTFGSSEESPRKKKSIKGEKEADESPRKKSKTAQEDEEKPTFFGDRPVEVTRSAELRALLKAAVKDVTPSGGSGFLRARTTSQAMRKSLTDSTKASESSVAAKELRKSANRQAKKALELESQIIEKEKELHDLREQLSKVREEEQRLLNVAQAHEAEAKEAKEKATDLPLQCPGSPVLRAEDMESPRVQPLGARILVRDVLLEGH